MKNKIFTIVLSIVFLLPFSVFATETTGESVQPENTTVETTEQNYENETLPPQSSLDEDSLEENSENINKIHYKTPISKRQLIKKFVLAMSGVGISVLILFFILNLKITKKITGQMKISDGENPLKSPDDIEEAVKTFLDKTNWKC